MLARWPTIPQGDELTPACIKALQEPITPPPGLLIPRETTGPDAKCSHCGKFEGVSHSHGELLLSSSHAHIASGNADEVIRMSTPRLIALFILLALLVTVCHSRHFRRTRASFRNFTLPIHNNLRMGSNILPSSMTSSFTSPPTPVNLSHNTPNPSKKPAKRPSIDNRSNSRSTSHSRKTIRPRPTRLHEPKALDMRLYNSVRYGATSLEIEALISRGANVNSQHPGTRYCNALQAAAANGNFKIAALLLQHGLASFPSSFPSFPS